MGDKAIRGNKLTKGPHGFGPKPYLHRPGVGPHGQPGGRIGKFGGGRTNLLEELGRVEAEPSNRNRRAEISRVHGELNRGYKTGGRVGLKHGKQVKKNGPVRPIDIPWSKPENPVSSKKAKGGRAGLKHGKTPGHYLVHGYGSTYKPKRTKKAAGMIVKSIPKLLKKLGTEIKAQPLPPQLQKTLDEVKKLQKLQKPGVKKAKGGRAGFKTGKIAGPKQQRLSRRVKQKEEKKDYKPKSYLEKDTEKQAKTSELMKYGMPKKYKPFPQHMDWKTGPVKSDAYKKRVSDVADIHIAHGGEGFKKGGKADKKWIQKATKGMVKTKPCTGKKFGSKSCPPGSRRYNLAKTFKKMGRERKAKG